MLARINILNILGNHFLSLRRTDQTKRIISLWDFILFFLFPLLLSSFLAYKNYTPKDSVESLIAAVSIFGGFLFNLLAIIYGQIEKIQNDANKEEDELKKRFVREIHSNISYSILLSIALVVSLLLLTVDIPQIKFDSIIKSGIIVLNYFLLFHFTLTLIMVLNRVYVLLNRSI